MQRIKMNKPKKDLQQARQVLAKNLRLLRYMKGLTQENVAHVLHISRSSYNYLESGFRTPDFTTLCRLAAYYDVSLDYLLTFDISEHIMHIIRKEKYEKEALFFLHKYIRLSRGGKIQIMKRISELKNEEDRFTIFPWDYQCDQEESE